MNETFDFLTALKYLLEGKRICAKDWVGSCLAIDRATNGVYNERGQRLDIMQFMNIKEWRLLDIGDVSESEPIIINTDNDQSYFYSIPDYRDIFIAEFTSYKEDFEGWSIPDYYNWIFKFTDNYHPHIGDIVVYADVAECHKERDTLDLCPTGEIVQYNDYVVYVKFSNKENIVEFSRQELKQICYLQLNELSLYLPQIDVYDNITSEHYRLNIKENSDIDYNEFIGTITDRNDNVTDITIVDLFMNYYWDDVASMPKFDVNKFKKTLEDESQISVHKLYETDDELYASIFYGKVPPKDGDNVISKDKSNYDECCKIFSATKHDITIISNSMYNIENYTMAEFTTFFNKIIPLHMPNLISKNGRLSNESEIYYEYGYGQKETFIVLNVNIKSFSAKGITIQRKNNPDDIYDISLITLHRLFTWEV